MREHQPTPLESLGITEDVYRNTRVTRRAVLKLPLAITLAQMLAACGIPAQPQEARSKEGTIRRELGVWTKEDIRNLGISMMSEPQYNDVAYAGWVLLENQERRQSFSLLSPLFDDERIKVITIENLRCPISSGCPMGAYIGEVGNPIQVPLRSKTDNSEVKLSGALKLHFKQIEIDRKLLSNTSDFIFKLVIAKEVFNAKSLAMAMSYAKSVNVDPYYYIAPEVPLGDYYERAIQIGRLQEDVEGIKVFLLADIWAHFLLIPNYLLAVEQRKVSRSDWGRGDLGVQFEDTFRIPAESFIREKVLTKNPQGVYEWNLDPDTFYRVWMDEALAWL